MSRQLPSTACDAPPVLECGSIHVWQVRTLSAAASDVDHSALSPEEQARAARFHFSEDRCQWVATRLVLRRLIAAYSGLPFRDVVVCQPGNRKPVVEACPRLKFSVSHTSGLSLIAIAWDTEVGVDTERIAPDRADIEGAGLVLSSEEVSDILALPEGGARALRFFERWTLKEAYGKCLGTGLTGELTAITLPLDGSAPAVGRLCEVVRLAVPAGYAAALCAGSAQFKVVPMAWAPP